MKPITLIHSNPKEKREASAGPLLEVAEFFCDTIQGEGVNMGAPSCFLRMQHCTLNCVWCDTRSVWRYGNPYSFDELFGIMDTNDVVGKLKQGQHLVLTGGSPLRQQEKLIQFLYEFMERYNFKPYIEIENECTLMPFKEMIEIVDCWNNSPKLQNSWNLHELRYKPEVLKQLSGLQNSWFKFVVSEEKDWEDIVTGYLIPSLIRRDQVILMPMAGNRAELEANRPVAIKMAIENNVRYSTREHVEIWDQLTGV